MITLRTKTYRVEANTQRPYSAWVFVDNESGDGHASHAGHHETKRLAQLAARGLAKTIGRALMLENCSIEIVEESDS